MTKSSALRVAPGADGVSIWSSEIFRDAEGPRLRDFLARAFSVREVEGVELRRASSFGRIHYPSVKNPGQIWKKLGRVLRSAGDTSQIFGPEDIHARSLDVGSIYLDAPAATRVRVTRIGDSLTTWRFVDKSDSTLRLWHPILRNRRDIVFRLEEELAAILGIEQYRASVLTGAVSIRFDKSAVTADRLARTLEKAWPRLLHGELAGPPSQKRFVAAVGLLGVAFTAQYVAPVVKPVALAGVTLYSSPNVWNAAKDLTRGEVGISALYTTGLALMWIGGSPFTAAVFATLMQFWPQLGRRKVVQSQRRLFAGQRRRPVWARVAGGSGVDVEVNVDDLHKGDLVVVRSGEIIPVDGTVEDGYAAVVHAVSGWDQVEDRSKGDLVAAGALVHDGTLTIRVERAGEQTSASYVDSLLPHAALAGLPSSQDVERIANRNAKPALALAALGFLVTRTPRMSQSVIRPDYATGPRLSAQLSVLHGIAQGLQHGVLFRNPAALDRLATAQAYVFDESAGLDRRSLEVATVQTVKGISEALVVSYALAAHRGSRSEQGRALADFVSAIHVVQPSIEAAGRYAGVARFRDAQGRDIAIASAAYLAASQLDIPQALLPAAGKRAKVRGRRAVPVEAEQVATDASLRPLWVLRDGAVIGVVSFARTGELVGRRIVAALHRPETPARVIYVSHAGAAKTRTLAAALGIELSHGGLSQSAKVDVIRGVSGNTIWIGDGADASAREAMAASTVSVSVAPLSSARDDGADVLLPLVGLAGLSQLLGIGRAHTTRLEQDYKTIYAANLLGVAGGLFAWFGGLQSGLLSHAGAGMIYARHARQLNRLASAVEANQAQRKLLASG